MGAFQQKSCYPNREQLPDVFLLLSHLWVRYNTIGVCLPGYTPSHLRIVLEV